MTQNIFTPNQINEVYLQNIFTLRGMGKIAGKRVRSNDEFNISFYLIPYSFSLFWRVLRLIPKIRAV